MYSPGLPCQGLSIPTGAGCQSALTRGSRATPLVAELHPCTGPEASAYERARAQDRAGSPGGRRSGGLDTWPVALRPSSSWRGESRDAGMYLITGGAGFIGSHIVEELIRYQQEVRVLDNFSSGTKRNLENVIDRIELIEGDIRDPSDVQRAMKGVRYVLHQAALCSVPRSIEDPAYTNDVNVQGTLNILLAARDAGVQRVVYASSSSVYGESHLKVQEEDQRPFPISAYAVSKFAGELYCRLFSRLHGLETVCLRYFNVFGPRQDPESEYAAVIPRFILWAWKRKPLQVHGDGTQSRDFTYIDNVVSANLLAARADAAAVSGKSYNVGCGSRQSLLD